MLAEAAATNGAPPTSNSGMKRFARVLGTVFLVGGIGLLAWSFVVWRWEDPFTSLYTR